MKGLIVIAYEKIKSFLESRNTVALEFFAEFDTRIELLDLLKSHKADRAKAVGGALDGLVVHNYGHVVAAEVNVIFKNVTARVESRLEGLYCIFGDQILDTSVRGDLNILSCCVFPSDSHFYFPFVLQFFKIYGKIITVKFGGGNENFYA